MRAVLRHREFRLLWLAPSASTLGDRIVFIALALYVTEIGSPSDVGLVLAANAIPLVLFVLIGGVWADRLERHRVMVVTDIVRALLHGLLAVLIFLGDVPIWAIVVIEAGFGTAEAFFNPAVTGLDAADGAEDELQQANAAMSVVQNAGELVGPGDRHRARARARRRLGVRGRRADVRGLRAAARPRAPALARGAGARASRCSPSWRGWREVRSRQWAWVVIAATSLALLLALGPFLTLGPTVAEDVYGSTGVYGALEVALGAGTVIGSLVGAALAAAAPDPLRDGVGRDLAAGVRAVRARAAAVGWSCPLFVLVGFGFSMFDVSWDTALAGADPAARAVARRARSTGWARWRCCRSASCWPGRPREAFGAVEVLVVGGVLGVLVAARGAGHAGGVGGFRNSPRPSSGVEASA